MFSIRRISSRINFSLYSSVQSFTKPNLNRLSTSSHIIDDSAPKQSLTSIVLHPYAIDGSPLSKETEVIRNELFAIIELSGTQYKVTRDDVIVADRIEGVDIGDDINIDKVLLVGTRSSTIVGRPLVSGAQVTVSVEELTKDKKVITLKVRRRKNSKNIKGFRRDLTILRVKDILLTNDFNKDIGL